MPEFNAVQSSPVSLKEFHELTSSLVSLPISRPRGGYYRTALFHLGNLTERPFRDGRAILEGEASLMLEWDWRVEKGKAIWFSSRNCVTKREKGLASLTGETLRSVMVEGRLPELVIELSNDRWIRSFGLVEEQPTWTVFPKRGGWITSRSGELVFESST